MTATPNEDTERARLVAAQERCGVPTHLLTEEGLDVLLKLAREESNE